MYTYDRKYVINPEEVWVSFCQLSENYCARNFWNFHSFFRVTCNFFVVGAVWNFDLIYGYLLQLGYNWNTEW